MTSLRLPALAGRLAARKEVRMSKMRPAQFRATFRSGDRAQTATECATQSAFRRRPASKLRGSPAHSEVDSWSTNGKLERGRLGRIGGVSHSVAPSQAHPARSMEPRLS